MQHIFKKLIFISLLINSFGSTLGASEVYKVDTQNSSVHYTALNDLLFFMDNTVIGTNKSISGDIEVQDNKLLNGTVVIKIKGFDTDNKYRDANVMGMLGFDINENITFEINKTSIIDGQLYLVGALEINSVTSTISMPVIKTYIGDSITYSGKMYIKYEDFGMPRPTIIGFVKKAKETVEIGATIRFIKTK